jgi:hypothetical protein
MLNRFVFLGDSEIPTGAFANPAATPSPRPSFRIKKYVSKANRGASRQKRLHFFTNPNRFEE